MLTLALAGLEYGRACEKLDDLDGADAGFGRAVAGLTALVKAHPGNLVYAQNLSITAAEYGDILLMRRKNPAEAKKMYTLAVIHIRPVAQPPELAGQVNLLALNYYRVAAATHMDGDPKNGQRLFGLCLEIREAQLRDAERRTVGGKPDEQAVLRARVNLMLVRARVGQHKEAAALGEEVFGKARGNASRLPYLACGFALCGAAADDKDLKAKYLDRAFACLTEAVDHGYANLAFLERDPDLEPARADGRFKDILDRVKTLGGKK
jgi:hypothetical protein